MLITRLGWKRDLKTVDQDARLDQIGLSESWPVEPVQHLSIAGIEDKARREWRVCSDLVRITASTDQDAIAIKRDPLPKTARNYIGLIADTFTGAEQAVVQPNGNCLCRPGAKHSQGASNQKNQKSHVECLSNMHIYLTEAARARQDRFGPEQDSRYSSQLIERGK
ncbi:MAG TPA: hypothetical protein VK090_04260 [Paracoccaceae bacterium]|nr:hypothetical protein [Paracoccaceae bacterium]